MNFMQFSLKLNVFPNTCLQYTLIFQMDQQFIRYFFLIIIYVLYITEQKDGQTLQAIQTYFLQKLQAFLLLFTIFFN